MTFRKEFKVRFGDVDHAGIVYYPALVNYTHLAMEDFFDDYLKYPYVRFLDEHRLGLPTVHIEMDFKRPLKYGDRIALESRVERIGTTSVEWIHEVYLQGRTNAGERAPESGALVAAARTVTVCTNLDTLEKVAVPAWLRERIERVKQNGGFT